MLRSFTGLRRAPRPGQKETEMNEREPSGPGKSSPDCSAVDEIRARYNVAQTWANAYGGRLPAHSDKEAQLHKDVGVLLDIIDHARRLDRLPHNTNPRYFIKSNGIEKND